MLRLLSDSGSDQPRAYTLFGSLGTDRLAPTHAVPAGCAKLSNRLKKFVVLAALSVLVGGSTAEEESFSLNNFSYNVIAIAQKEFPALKLSRTESPLSLKLGDTGRLSLENLYRQVRSCATAEKENEEIRRFLKGINEVTPDPKKQQTLDEVKSRIRPQIFPSTYLRDQKSKTMIVNRSLPFSKRLLEGYVIDSQNTFQYITREQLKTWKTDVSTISKLAYENLEKSAESDVQPKDAQGAPGKFVTIASPDGYSAARILLPSVRRKLQDELGRPCYIAIPNRDILLAWSDNFSGAEKFVQTVMKEYRTRHHPLSPVIFKLENMTLEPDTKKAFSDQAYVQ